MNDLVKTFNNAEFGNVRVIEKNNEPWFVGKDVALILGYAKPLNALATHVDEDDSLKQGLTDSMGRVQETILVNESGVYSLVFSSKLPTAKKFKHWVTSEILPTIRKHGAYMSAEVIEQALLNPDTLIKLATDLKEERAKRIQAEKLIEEQKPKALFADAVSGSDTSILVGNLAKLIKQNGIDIGQNRLFEWLRNNGYLIKSGDRKNMPTQMAMEQKLFEVKERTVLNADGSSRITRTPMVTGKGQVFFINKFLEGKA